MKICHFIDHLDGGGGQGFIYNIIEQSDPETFDHSVCYLKEKDTHTSLRPKFVDANIPVTCFHAESESLSSVVTDAIRYFRRQDFDILHMHTVYAQILGRILRPVANIDHTISTYHMMPSASYQNAVIRYLDEITRRFDDSNVAVSTGVMEAYRGRSEGNWQTIVNGVDVDYYHSGTRSADPPAIAERTSDGLNFINIGRFVPEKSQSDLVRAMVHVLKSLPDSNLFVIGGGRLKDRMQTIAEQKGIERCVHLIDHVSSVLEYYSMADVFVLSSVNEGLPLVILEAMAAELPVIATDIPGVNEVVLNGKTGFLVPPGSPEQLAEKMVEMDSDQLRTSMGVNGYQRVVNHFDISQTVDTYHNLYEGVLGG